MAGPAHDLTINGRFLSQRTTGVQRVARELTRAIDDLIAAGTHHGRVRLVCEQGADLSDLPLRHVEVQFAPGPSGYLWEQVTLPGLQGRSTLLCLGNTAPLASLLAGRRVAVLIHDLSYRFFPHAYSRAYRLAHTAMLPLLLRRADPIITVSESERAILLGLAPAAAPRLVVAQNGSWREDGAASLSRTVSARPGYLLYVGSFSQRKNFGGVLEVAIRLAREDGTETVIVGSGSNILTSPPVHVPADVRGLIHFAGQIDGTAELAAIYADAGCLVFPSFYEASPLPPIEAMRFGCPVVASDLPAMRERCGDAVAYCDPHSTEDVIAKVRRLLRDPAEAGALAARGAARSKAFSWQAQASAILAAIARADG